MINHIDITNFKCLDSEQLDIRPLTIITGLNSTGKSSLIQSLLLPTKLFSKNGQRLLDNLDSSFTSIRNLYMNAKEVNVTVYMDNKMVDCIIKQEETLLMSPESPVLELENDLYYLSANRIGAEFNSKISADFKIGIVGEYILGTFEKEKSYPIIGKLIKNQSSFTLSSQVNYWLSYVLGIPMELQTEKRTEQSVEVRYKSDGIPNITPFQLGSGVGYLTKILIMCLRAKENNVLIIENPEIHLHPAAQSRLGEFFVFIANAGIQLIIETHCEHLIFKVQHQVYKKNFDSDKVQILYKKSITERFSPISLRKDGKFLIDFPDGFFDVSIADLIERE